MSTDILASELNYNTFGIERGAYQLVRVIQQSGGQYVPTGGGTATIGSSGQESVFELPPRVYNFAKSSLSYIIGQLVAPSGGGTLINTFFADTIGEIRQLQLYTRTGLFLADINFANNYVKAVLRHETKLDEMLENDQPLGQSTNAFQGTWEGLYRPVHNIAINGVAGNGSTYVNTQIPSVPGLAISSAFSPVAMITTSATNAIGPFINRNYRLELFKNSIFALDKDLYFGGETLYMRIVWDGLPKVAYRGTDVNNVAGSVDPNLDNTHGFQIQNLTLYMAIEQNPLVENKLKEKCMSAEGLRVLMPFVYTNRLSVSGSSQTIIVRYNRAHGQKLIKVLWAPFNSTESGNTAYDHNNISYAAPVASYGSKISSFYTTVNNYRTSQFNYDCTQINDYMVKSKKLKGSAITDINDYYVNWVWREEFDNNYTMYEKPLNPPEQNYVDGLDLTNEQIYTIYSNIASANGGAIAGLNHYIFGITQKELVVGPGGIQVM